MTSIRLRRRAALGLAGAALLAAPRPVLAQPRFPDRPLRIVVPFPPGQANDIFARLIADKASELRWPQHRIIVDNRSGAAGTIGTAAVVQSPPDGHTLVFGSLATLAINPAISRNIPYDVERDLAPVIRVFEGSLLAVVPAASLHTDLAALIRRLRASRDTPLPYASSGPGSTQHMAAELFLQGIEARATHVPYRGSGPAMTDLAAGAVDFAFESVQVALPLLRGGQLRALAVSSAARLPVLPDVPTVAEAAGLRDYRVYGSGGLLVPARTPTPIIEALYEGFAAAMADEAVRARFRDIVATPLAERPEDFARFIRAELAKWREVARRGDIRLD